MLLILGFGPMSTAPMLKKALTLGYSRISSRTVLTAGSPVSDTETKLIGGIVELKK